MNETIRVYFAEIARFASVVLDHRTKGALDVLKRDQNGIYIASTRADYLALRPYEVQS